MTEDELSIKFGGYWFHCRYHGQNCLEYILESQFNDDHELNELIRLIYVPYEAKFIFKNEYHNISQEIYDEQEVKKIIKKYTVFKVFK